MTRARLIRNARCDICGARRTPTSDLYGREDIKAFMGKAFPDISAFGHRTTSGFGHYHFDRFNPHCRACFPLGIDKRIQYHRENIERHLDQIGQGFDINENQEEIKENEKRITLLQKIKRKFKTYTKPA